MVVAVVVASSSSSSRSSSSRSSNGSSGGGNGDGCSGSRFRGLLAVLLEHVSCVFCGACQMTLIRCCAVRVCVSFSLLSAIQV